MLIERLGRFSRVATSGLNVIVPFLDRPRGVYWTNVRPNLTSIDLREQYIDLPPQPVITRDNVTINVDSVVYWQITDPVKAVYEVTDLVGGLVQLTITGMRSVMGEMDLDHTLSSRDQINAKLRLILDEATDKWGVKVTRVDVKNINPPEDVRLTMEKQMTAERNRRALVLQAEGDKQAAITRAEGEKQASVTRGGRGAGASARRRSGGRGHRAHRAGDVESGRIGAVSHHATLHREFQRDGARQQHEGHLHADGDFGDAIERRRDQRDVRGDGRAQCAQGGAKHPASTAAPVTDIKAAVRHQR
jgi:regulator of protease activity HflC (stomatin/prohibitin superfamily)